MITCGQEDPTGSDIMDEHQRRFQDIDRARDAHHIIFIGGISAAFILYQLNQSTLGAIALGVVAALTIIFYGFGWRCPKCNAGLGMGVKSKCQRCGTHLRVDDRGYARH